MHELTEPLYHHRVALRLGHSIGVTLPPAVCRSLRLLPGDIISFTLTEPNCVRLAVAARGPAHEPKKDKRCKNSAKSR